MSTILFGASNLKVILSAANNTSTMKCPNDTTTLIMSERSGVEIDYCPECRGVWLDRGELDKIIAKSESTSVARPSSDARRDEPRYDSHSYNDRKNDPHYKKKRKESFLGDLFDF